VFEARTPFNRACNCTSCAAAVDDLGLSVRKLWRSVAEKPQAQSAAIEQSSGCERCRRCLSNGAAFPSRLHASRARSACRRSRGYAPQCLMVATVKTFVAFSKTRSQPGGWYSFGLVASNPVDPQWGYPERLRARRIGSGGPTVRGNLLAIAGRNRSASVPTFLDHAVSHAES